MPSVRDRQFLVESYDSSIDFHLESDAVYISGTSAEPRTGHVPAWTSESTSIVSLLITVTTAYSFKAFRGNLEAEYSLRSERLLNELWQTLPDKTTYLDVTGIAHHVWAPLLRAGLKIGRQLRIVYVEPEHYKFSVTPTEGEIFDLSEKISGVAPLPGFAAFGEAAEENTCFIPLLGFEGIRFAHILEHVQPLAGKIMPIVGAPGFKVEYPFHTYHGNRRTLLDSRAWRNIRFACANNPFSLFFALEDISAAHPRDRLKIAPIGTKPHAVGAILYALANPRGVEIIYDHPIRKPDRTAGSGKIFVYDVSTFMRS